LFGLPLGQTYLYIANKSGKEKSASLQQSLPAGRANKHVYSNILNVRYELGYSRSFDSQESPEILEVCGFIIMGTDLLKEIEELP
jgi:hypothetical protein